MSSKALEAIRLLKAAKESGGGLAKRVEIKDERVFDVVTHEQYEKNVAQKRKEGNFVEDDGASGQEAGALRLLLCNSRALACHGLTQQPASPTHPAPAVFPPRAEGLGYADDGEDNWDEEDDYSEEEGGEEGGGGKGGGKKAPRALVNSGPAQGSIFRASKTAAIPTSLDDVRRVTASSSSSRSGECVCVCA